MGIKTYSPRFEQNVFKGLSVGTTMSPRNNVHIQLNCFPSYTALAKFFQMNELIHLYYHSEVSGRKLWWMTGVQEAPENEVCILSLCV